MKNKKSKVGLWSALTAITAILTIAAIVGNIIANQYATTINVALNASTYKIIHDSSNTEDTEYFKSDFASDAEREAYEAELCAQVEAEGATLLKNQNAALPLAQGAKVSLFGHGSVDLMYGGTGSGSVDTSKAPNFKQALESQGISVNETLWNLYSSDSMMSKYSRMTPASISDTLEANTQYAVNEAPWSALSSAESSFAEYGDAAIVVLSRSGGEGADLPSGENGTNDSWISGQEGDGNYLTLSAEELELLQNLKALKDNGTFKSIIVLLNSSNAIELDFLNPEICGEDYGIDAAMWIGDVGQTGINGVAQLLSGAVTPSGSLVDTYLYDNMANPAMYNFYTQAYPNAAEYNLLTEGADVQGMYSVYQEGIYLGYRYFETRYEDVVMGTANAGDYDWAKTVAYPFGYGDSYTDFTYSNFNVTESDDAFDISLTVTNSGKTYSGKETVQVYFQSPYTDYDKANGIEKAAVELAGFAKTDVLAPGASETVNITVNKSELRTYDANKAKTYIVDAGDYYFAVGTDSHNALNNILAAKGYTVASTNGKMTADGDADLTYAWTEDKLDTTTYSVSENGTAITNQLSCADPNLYDGEDNTVTWLSRSDWNGTLPTETVKLALTEQLKKDLQDIRYDPADYETVNLPAMGKNNGVTLYDMIGLDYDDPKWDDLLDNLTFDEMNTLIGDAFHWTMPVKSIEAPGTRDENGPQGLTASLLGSGATQLTATAFTSEDVMAATFNTDLMTAVGTIIGNNCLSANIACLYGPGNNIHRTPYGGRNFEYYSEDGFLSGMMSAYEVAAIQAKGVHVVMKHFALNDCEQDRIGLGVWINEQAAREVYLKAFQAPIEVGNGNGVMIAYTRWGAVWSGGNAGLVNGILRGEWGCDGMVITDNVLNVYVNGPDGVLAGVSIYDAMMPYVTDKLPEYKNDGVIVSAMREACHHNLYAIANSCGMNGVGANTTIKLTRPTVITMVIIITCAAAFFCLLGIVLWIFGVRKLRKTEEYKAYKGFLKDQKAAKKA